MSKYISNGTDEEKILKSIEKFRNKHQSKITEPTIETLRKIRYGKKYP